MNRFLYLFLGLLLVPEVSSISVASKDHPLDYYPFPAETKNSVVNGISYHDTDIEDAEEDDEDYEEGAFKADNKLSAPDDAGKLKLDPKTSSSSVQGQPAGSRSNSVPPQHGSLPPSDPPAIAEGGNAASLSPTSTATNSTTTDLHTTPSVIASNSTAISNNLPIGSNTTTSKLPNATGSKGSAAGQLIVGLQLTKGLANTTRRTGQSIELRCVFKCTKNAAGEKCDLKPSSVKWTKNESPLRNQKNKVEITFVRRKNKGKPSPGACEQFSGGSFDNLETQVGII